MDKPINLNAQFSENELLYLRALVQNHLGLIHTHNGTLRERHKLDTSMMDAIIFEIEREV